eukprot:Anaeramoba_ignava/a217599_28.p1 GENE.a217599_28~~a217599_28.p1  ORF type:complete len:713 (+),score=250.60 a217599_28:320-2458(+)
MTETSINFFDIKKKEKDYLWKIETVESIHKRRCNFNHSALEIIFENRKCVFFNFPTVEERNEIYEEIEKNKFITIGKSKYNYSGNEPTKWIEKSRMTQKWQKRKITNFEYLMYLNTISGRTYQDLSQYPVFPWILSDYESEKLDLNDPKIFRDLSKPIGLLNNRIIICSEKEMQFNYQKNYSNPEIVSSYLIRLEPFTSICLKEKYPVFKSVHEEWKTINKSNHDDFRELIPEFFHLPDFLRKPKIFKHDNLNKKEIAIEDVVLPKWAKTSEEFIQIHQEALESEYVSEHLNEWIDLVFGYKQKGEEAKKSNNLFHPNLYEENIDFSNLNEEKVGEIKRGIQTNGQIPVQLFNKKHPKRQTKEEIHQKMSSFPSFEWKNILSSSESFHSTKFKISTSPIIFTNYYKMLQKISLVEECDKIITFDQERIIGNHRWDLFDPNRKNPKFAFEIDENLEKKQKIGISFSQDFNNFQECTAVDKNSDYLICGGFCDNTFKIFEIENYKMTQIVSKHRDIVNCLAMDWNYIATGSKDTTVIVWEFDANEGKVKEKPKHVFFEQEKEVKSVAISIEYDIVLSGSIDGKLIFHSLNKGKLIKSIILSDQKPISIIQITKEGNIITFSENSNILRLFAINGDLIKEFKCSQNINSISITQDSNFLILGGEEGILEILNLLDLNPIRTFKFEKQKIYSTLVTANGFIIIGLGNGELRIGNLN